MLSRIFKILEILENFRNFRKFFENFENFPQFLKFSKKRTIYVRTPSHHHVCQIWSFYLFWMPYYSPPKSSLLCTFGILVSLVLDSVLGWCFTYKWMLLSSFWGKIGHKTCVATQNLYILKNVTFWPDLDLGWPFDPKIWQIHLNKCQKWFPCQKLA